MFIIVVAVDDVTHNSVLWFSSNMKLEDWEAVDTSVLRAAQYWYSAFGHIPGMIKIKYGK